MLPLGGRHGGLWLTTGHYFTPSGKSIDSTGIMPDIQVVQNVLSNPVDDHALKLAYDLLRGAAYNKAFPPSQAAAAVPRQRRDPPFNSEQKGLAHRAPQSGRSFASRTALVSAGMIAFPQSYQL